MFNLNEDLQVIEFFIRISGHLGSSFFKECGVDKIIYLHKVISYKIVI